MPLFSRPSPRLRAIALLTASVLLLAGVLTPTHPHTIRASSDPKQEGAQLFASSGCVHCHGATGQGTEKGPAIANVQKKQEGDKTVISGEIVQEGDPYRLFIPIRVDLESGTPVQNTVEVASGMTPFRIVVSGSPKSLSLDPDGNLLISGAAAEGSGDPFVHSFVPAAGG